MLCIRECSIKSKISKRAYSVLLVLILICLLFPGLLFAGSAGSAGKLSLVIGRVDVLSPGTKRAVPVKKGHEVFVGDIIRTKSNSRARISLLDGSEITLSEKSRLEVKNFSYNKKESIRNILFKSFRGLMRIVASKLLKNKSSTFNIETPSAVAGVKGTDFFTMVKGEVTNITVIEGEVEVRNIDPRIGGIVRLGQFQSSRVRRGNRPSRPRIVKPSEVDALSRGEEGGDEDGGSEGNEGDAPPEFFKPPETPPVTGPHPLLLKPPVNVNIDFPPSP